MQFEERELDADNLQPPLQRPEAQGRIRKENSPPALSAAWDCTPYGRLKRAHASLHRRASWYLTRSNRQPTPFQGVALPFELRHHVTLNG